MQVDVYKIDGTLSGEKVELDAAIFEITPNDHAIYQAVRSIQANQPEKNRTRTCGYDALTVVDGWRFNLWTDAA